MSWPAITVSPATTVGDAAALAEAAHIHHLPVVDNGALAGVLCVCDLWNAPPATEVERCMQRWAIAVHGGAPALRAASIMRLRGVGCLPVIAGRRVVGVITAGDLLRLGVVDHDLRPACAACGNRHHVRMIGDGRIGFCASCIDRPQKYRDLYEDLGGFD
jgi:CBS domain-containing protein